MRRGKQLRGLNHIQVEYVKAAGQGVIAGGGGHSGRGDNPVILA